MDYWYYFSIVDINDFEDQMIDFKNKTVIIIGAAKSGQASAYLLRKLNAKVKISEAGSEDSVDAGFRLWARKEKIDFEFNGHTKDFVESSDLVVLSPGVRRDALVVGWAKAKNIAVWGEIELAARVCKKPIIAIT